MDEGEGSPQQHRERRKHPNIVSASLDVLKQVALAKRFPHDIPADSVAPQETALPVQIHTLEDHLSQISEAAKSNGGTLSTFFAPNKVRHKEGLKENGENPILTFEYYGEGNEPPYLDFIHYSNKSGKHGYRFIINFGEIPGREDEKPLLYDSKRKGIRGIKQHEYNAISYFLDRALTDIDKPKPT